MILILSIPSPRDNFYFFLLLQSKRIFEWLKIRNPTWTRTLEGNGISQLGASGEGGCAVDVFTIIR